MCAHTAQDVGGVMPVGVVLGVANAMLPVTATAGTLHMCTRNVLELLPRVCLCIKTLFSIVYDFSYGSWSFASSLCYWDPCQLYSSPTAMPMLCKSDIILTYALYNSYFVQFG